MAASDVVSDGNTFNRKWRFKEEVLAYLIGCFITIALCLLNAQLVRQSQNKNDCTMAVCCRFLQNYMGIFVIVLCFS